MLCITNNHTNPAFNIAAEEYMLDHFTDDICRLWFSKPSITIGKHQNTLAEINADYVEEKDIKIVRRLTGGGAVFHDLGTLNFTFIDNSCSGNFRTFTQPILDVLNKLGVNAKFEGRNDLTIDGRKFSGNAQCIRNKKMLHHGTILFSTEMNDLSSALKVNPLKFQDKAVKSVRKRVTNISEHLKSPISIDTLRELIMQHVVETNKDCKKYELSQHDIDQINKLCDEKYSTWEWNFGNSPEYTFSKLIRTEGGNVEAHMKIENGTIIDVKIYGDFFAKKEIADFEKIFIGKQHKTQEIENILQNVSIDDYIYNAKQHEIMNLLF